MLIVTNLGRDIFGGRDRQFLSNGEYIKIEIKGDDGTEVYIIDESSQQQSFLRQRKGAKRTITPTTK